MSVFFYNFVYTSWKRKKKGLFSIQGIFFLNAVTRLFFNSIEIIADWISQLLYSFLRGSKVTCVKKKKSQALMKASIFLLNPFRLLLLNHHVTSFQYLKKGQSFLFIHTLLINCFLSTLPILNLICVNSICLSNDLD